MQWIPWTKLDRADFISCIIDPDDWQITTCFFEFLDYTWGPHTVDCFANFYNRKVNKFYLRFWNPWCSGVDFFVQNLTGENCLVVPPVNLIHRTIHYLFTFKAVATLVVPVWPLSHFWPTYSRNFFSFVMVYKLFSGRTVLEHGWNTNSLLHSKRFFGQMLVVHVKFWLHDHWVSITLMIICSGYKDTCLLIHQ